MRRPDLAGHLQPLGRVGQVHAVQANLRYPASVEAAVAGADVVINLVGILFERGRQRFDAVQAEGPGWSRAASAAAGARMIHVSALGASRNSPALYARTKAAGEQAVRAEAPGAVIFRPSIVFGPEDDFFNQFAAHGAARRRCCRWSAAATPGSSRCSWATSRRRSPWRPTARAQPGTIYELGGPDVRTFRAADGIRAGDHRAQAPAGAGPVRGWPDCMASILQFMPKPLLTPDQVRMLEVDNVVSADATRERRTFEGLGIEPRAMTAIVPSYLWRFRKTGQFRSRMA